MASTFSSYRGLAFDPIGTQPSWTRPAGMWFLFRDVVGEFLGVFIYVTLGRVFSDRVLAIDALLGDLSWAIVTLLAAVWLGWKLIKG